MDTATDADEPKFPPRTFEEIAGYLIGIFSAIMYLGSRMPQIAKNFKRRTTDGLSPLLFFCAFMGNLTYSVSIFLFSLDWDHLLSKAPWIVGSAGVLVLDFVVLSQFVIFRTASRSGNKAAGHSIQAEGYDDDDTPSAADILQSNGPQSDDGYGGGDVV